MEQLSFFHNETTSNKLRRYIVNIRSRVDQSVSIANVGLADGPRELNMILPQFSKLPRTVSRRSAELGPNHKRLILREASERYVVSTRLRDLAVVDRSPRGRQFIPHAHIISSIERTLIALRINPEEVDVEVKYGSYGAQMSLVVTLPGIFDFDPGQMDPFRLQIVFHNCLSRGGLRLLARWFQEDIGTIFSVGVSQLNASLAHRIPAREENILPTFRKAIELAREDSARLCQWITQDIKDIDFQRWVAGSVRRMWGRKGKQEVQTCFESGEEHQSVFDILINISGYSMKAKDILKQCDRVVEGAVLMRSLLKKVNN
ncbi:MAG: hypothetical protein CBB82_05985 [Betaproteobacteria bacterium TMED22]|nr:MAG: hypothetical protein CBB82_05985 [Betaproteobacteria bacterium TMED22]